MRSISLLVYNRASGALEEVGRDYNANWTTAVAMLDDDYYIGAEHMTNLFTVHRNTDSATDEERARLDPAGEFHLGDQVNRFRHGSLVSRQLDEGTAERSGAALPTPPLATDGGGGGGGNGGGEGAAPSTPPPAAARSNAPSVPAPPSDSVVFGTVGGAIGAILRINHKQFQFFTALQRAITRVTGSFGNLSHSQWRAFENERRWSEWRGFLDGDVVESFLDLSKENMEGVVKVLADDGWDSAALPSRPGEEEPQDKPADQQQEDGSSDTPRRPLTVDDITLQVEEMTRRH